MIKMISVLAGIFFLAACSSHAPEPSKAKGEWYELNTTVQAMKAGTY